MQLNEVRKDNRGGRKGRKHTGTAEKLQKHRGDVTIWKEAQLTYREVRKDKTGEGREVEHTGAAKRLQK